MKYRKLIIFALAIYLSVTGCSTTVAGETDIILSPSPDIAPTIPVVSSSIPSPTTDLVTPAISDMPPLPLPDYKKYEVNCADGYTAEVNKEIVSVESVPYNGNYIYTVTLTQGKDGSFYEFTVKRTPEASFEVTIYNENGDEFQTITDERQVFEYNIIDFVDVNLDGYADIQINFGGTRNQLHKLYVWNPEAQEFFAVECDEDIFYYDVNSDGIRNHGKVSYCETIIQDFIWESDYKLVLVDEYREIIEAPKQEDLD